MTITWIQLTPSVWIADVQAYRGVIMHLCDTQDGWVAQIEKGDEIHPANIIFHTLESAEQWATLTLRALAEHD